jgi:hypothetical protein
MAVLSSNPVASAPAPAADASGPVCSLQRSGSLWQLGIEAQELTTAIGQLAGHTHEVLPAIRRYGRYSLPGLAPTPASLHSDKQDSVGALLLIGQAVAQVPGVKPGIAMAATLTCIQENTGLATETLRRALPATEDPICSLNATGLWQLLGMKAKDTNQHLAACELQIRNQRGEWELTNAGLHWAEALPYCRGGHSGYQILWNPAPWSACSGSWPDGEPHDATPIRSSPDLGDDGRGLCSPWDEPRNPPPAAAGRGAHPGQSLQALGLHPGPGAAPMAPAALNATNRA